MTDPEVIVVGAGISGLAFATAAADAGRRVLVLEASERVGGCLHSERLDDGYWFELGAHTCYNSYTGALELIRREKLTGSLLPRGPARARFGLVQNGSYSWLTPPKILRRLHWLELVRSLPHVLGANKERETLASYYGRILGRRNFSELLSPFFAAVPSQRADDFPAAGAGSLFKKRQRDKTVNKSFSIEDGLQSLCEALTTVKGITVETNAPVLTVGHTAQGFYVQLEGRRIEAKLLAIATPLPAARALCSEELGEFAAVLARIGSTQVESVGVVLPRQKVWLPEVAFIVPTDDIFYSAVTRDPIPHPKWRALTFHFKPGTPAGDKKQRICDLLRIRDDELEILREAATPLPSPTVGHASVIGVLDRLLSGRRLALLGNYFSGLAIEDCVQRARSEWQRLSGFFET